MQNPCSDWLPPYAWDEFCKVQELPSFANIAAEFYKNQMYWKVIYDDFNENFRLPNPWQEKLSNFERLIIIRILRPDKLLLSITSFVKGEMDDRFIRPPPFSISASYDESYSLCPLIFILSPGTDPISTLVKFASEKNMAEKFKSISLGQGDHVFVVLFVRL